MVNLSTTYLGLNLKNPIIVASSGLTENLKSLQEIEKNGAAAVVLKSIFEEEITNEYEAITAEAEQLGYHDEHMDYFDYQIREKNLLKYVELISNAKKELSIPVIASINCHSSHEWEYFAANCEKAGADAIELNIFISPSDISLNCELIQKRYFTIIEKILNKVTIPVSLKISPYFSDLGSMIFRLSKTGIKGMTLFNRFFSPDFDIYKMEVSSSFVFSHADEIAQSLRWVSLMSSRVDCDLAASTGIHSGEAIIKQILGGASAVQIASVLYQNGTEYISTMLSTLEKWMKEKSFDSIDSFKGKLSQTESSNAAVYERVQFMKYFSGKF